MDFDIPEELKDIVGGQFARSELRPAEVAIDCIPIPRPHSRATFIARSQPSNCSVSAFTSSACPRPWAG